MTWLLLDADMLLFQAVVSAEVEIEWCPDIITTHLPVKEAKLIFTELVETKVKQAEADKFTLCWTADQNFRKEVAPSYKANRQKMDRRKPVGYLPVRRWAESSFPSECWHKLETRILNRSLVCIWTTMATPTLFLNLKLMSIFIVRLLPVIPLTAILVALGLARRQQKSSYPQRDLQKPPHGEL
jgi:hypothetical protein